MKHHNNIPEAELYARLMLEFRGLHPSTCISVLEKLLDRYKSENRKRIYSGKQFNPVELERPDLDTMK